MGGALKSYSRRYSASAKNASESFPSSGHCSSELITTLYSSLVTKLRRYIANQTFDGCTCRPVALKVFDIDPQGSIGPSKVSINSQRVEWGSLNGQRSMKNCWGLLEIGSPQFKIIVNRPRNANGLFQPIKQN